MIRKTMKWSVIAVLALAVGGVLLGPDRVRDLAGTAREHIVQNVDEMIDPEVQLTNEIKNMQREFPRQIAALRSQIREIDRALREVTDEVAVAEQVVTLCDGDIALLEGAAAVNPTLVPVGATTHRPAANARTQLVRVVRTKEAYEHRLELAQEEQAALEVERNRVKNELTSLEEEAQDFQMQVALLEREIEALQRGDMLIEIAQKRRALEDRAIDRRASTALQRIYTAVDERRAEQTEILRGIQERETNVEYETRAKLLLSGHGDPRIRSATAGTSF